MTSEDYVTLEESAYGALSALSKSTIENAIKLRNMSEGIRDKILGSRAKEPEGKEEKAPPQGLLNETYTIIDAINSLILQSLAHVNDIREAIG